MAVVALRRVSHSLLVVFGLFAVTGLAVAIVVDGRRPQVRKKNKIKSLPSISELRCSRARLQGCHVHALPSFCLVLMAFAGASLREKPLGINVVKMKELQNLSSDYYNVDDAIKHSFAAPVLPSSRFCRWPVRRCRTHPSKRKHVSGPPKSPHRDEVETSVWMRVLRARGVCISVFAASTRTPPCWAPRSFQSQASWELEAMQRHYMDGHDGTAQLVYHLLHISILQPLVQLYPALTRQLLLWCWYNDSAFTWVFGKIFFYLRRRLQQHPSVAGTFLPRQLHRPALHRRYARSVHPGACVVDAPAYTPRRRIRPTQRLSRRCCLLLRSLDFDVSWSSLEDLM